MIYYAIAFNKIVNKYTKIRLLCFNKETVLQESKIIDVDFSDLSKYKVVNIRKKGNELVSENGSINRYPTQEDNISKNKDTIIILYRTENGFIICNSIGKIIKATTEDIIKSKLKIANGKIVDNKFISAIEGEYEMFCEEGADLSKLEVNNNKFECEVTIGKDLLNFVKNVSSFTPRYFVNDVLNYLEKEAVSKIGGIYGVRRTGKTYGIYHCIEKLLKTTDKIAYITFKEDTSLTMKNLYNDLKTLHNLGIKYVFIDEITYISDFLGGANLLSDIYNSFSKIIVSGTNSLVLNFSTYHVLFGGRIKLFNTTYMGYKEFAEVAPYGKNRTSFEDYVKTGGIFEISKNYIEEKNIEDEVLKNYVNDSISENITDSIIKFLPYDRNCNIPENIKSLIESEDDKDKVKKKIKTLIEKIIDKDNNEFILDILNNSINVFKQADIRNNFPKLKNINYEEVIRKTKEKLLIDETIKYDAVTVAQMKEYLITLDVICEYPVYKMGIERTHYLITQPALRYYQLQILMKNLLNEDFIIGLSEYDKIKIVRQSLRYILGYLYEHTVINNVLHINDCPAYKSIYQIIYDRERVGDIDMVLYNSKTHKLNIYEIKKDKNEKIQYKWIRWISEAEGSVCQKLEKEIIGIPINERYLLYMGSPKNYYYEPTNKTIICKNIEEYLRNLTSDNLI